MRDKSFVRVRSYLLPLSGKKYDRMAHDYLDGRP